MPERARLEITGRMTTKQAASGALYHVALGGRRDFTSSSGIRARTYEVRASSDDRAEQAERVLRRGRSSSAVL